MKSHNFTDMHMIRTESKGRDEIQVFASSCIPEFTNAKDFAEKKITMLEKDFKIDLTRDEIIHIYSLKTEHDINAAVKAILNDRWK